MFPEAGGELNAAAARYERELDALEPLYEICHTAKHEDNFPEDARARARALLSEALDGGSEGGSSYRGGIGHPGYIGVETWRPAIVNDRMVSVRYRSLCA